MPAIIFFACLDIEQKSSFLDGHWLGSTQRKKRFEKLIITSWNFHAKKTILNILFKVRYGIYKLQQ
jgi:hypothetical protein